jgi:phosphate uptake regulator
VNYLVADHQLSQPLASIQRLGSMVQSATNRVLEAFAQGDLSLTDQVLVEIREANAVYDQAYQELLTAMQSKPAIANQAIYLSRAAYNLRRAGERVAGLSEWVVFSVTGTMGQQEASLPLVVGRDDLSPALEG